MIGHQQYIVQPSSLLEASQEDDTSGSTTSNSVISETALTHAPNLNEQTLREHGVSLSQAIQQVIIIIIIIIKHLNYLNLT